MEQLLLLPPAAAGRRLGLVLGRLVLLLAIIPSNHCHRHFPVSAEEDGNVNRSSFPAGFVFGAGSSAYQYEGAANVDGRGPSIWDVFTNKYPGRIDDGNNGDRGVDFYYRYKEDIKLIKDVNMNGFRISISWSRILPTGRISGGVNEKGIMFYHNLIDELLSNGIEPFVTIYHFDLPQALEEEYGGFLSPRIVDDYKEFAELCFREYGGKVKKWITINEPWTISIFGYEQGIFAPGRCSDWVNPACQAGDSATEPYIVSHHVLLSHASAVNLYRQKFQKRQNGEIGIVLNCFWMLPYSNSTVDKAAAERAVDFVFGWHMEPITFGRYPKSMEANVGERLPNFTEEQSLRLIGSYDFVGVNYYSSFYAMESKMADQNRLRYQTDSLTEWKSEKDGIPIGPHGALFWLNVYPQGIRDVMNHVKSKYNNPPMYITENGLDEEAEGITVEESLHDPKRTQYIKTHLLQLQKAINEDGANVRGYFAWSFLDNYEWCNGYAVRFGLHYVDYQNGMRRVPKHSANWFADFLLHSNHSTTAAADRHLRLTQPQGSSCSS
ncbi:unnamed protein product [Linum tenue]|uniref:Beta-glucosidase n=1 Tax=Linum tenue TaxID=586396 RepID=A0AAV0J1J2_9ROSI|nr:unnamed protein product [Linum tenue]